MARSFRVNIVDGPSKYDLSVALFHGGSSERHKVVFRLKRTDEPVPWVGLASGKPAVPAAVCTINAAEREDGSGENWNFRGYLQGHPSRISSRVSGYYNTQHRTGWIEFTED